MVRGQAAIADGMIKLALSFYLLFLSFFLSLSLRLSSCCIKGSHSSSKRTQTNQIFSLTLTDIFTQISICQPKVCWAGGKGGAGSIRSAAVGDVLICQGNPVLCFAAFLLPTDLILKSFSAFTQIKMMTTLAKRQLWQRHRQRDRN